jgi:histidinol-phosphate/aromatic aminotransferase/cobyric acid decarboxylase-like protein
VDYASFKRFREDLLGIRSPLRLDCMNPVRALASFVEPLAEDHGDYAVCPGALAAWARATGVSWTEGGVVLGSGIRGLLSATLKAFGSQVNEIWLPADVYPVYWEMARDVSVELHSFPTLPQPDWGFLHRASDGALVLLPWPLTPLGRLPSGAETEALARWLGKAAGRVLVLDAAYTYDFKLVRRSLEPVLASGACVVLWSCSKPWLLPGVLGIATAPTEVAPLIARHAEPPSEEALRKAETTLERSPGLPRLQQEAFYKEWERLAPRLQKACPEWQPPACGYFSVLPLPFQHLLDGHDILGVPASVFGSPHAVSVITCLHDLAAHRLVAPNAT